MASSVITTIYEALTGKSDTKSIGVVYDHENRSRRSNKKGAI